MILELWADRWREKIKHGFFEILKKKMEQSLNQE